MSMLKRGGSVLNYVKMKTDDMYDIDPSGADVGAGKRMGRGEQDMLITLYGSALMIDQVIGSNAMRDRIGGVNRGFARLKTAHTNVHNLLEDIFKTVPADQMEHMRRQMSATHYFSYVGRNPLTYERDMGRWLSMKELDMVVQVCRQQCKYCELDDVQDQRKCLVNKIMRLMPMDNSAGGNGACGWLETLGSTWGKE